MVRTLITRGFVALFVGVAVTGCTRGLFIGSPCSAAQREAVDSNAASAIYLDKHGNPINPRAELLKDTRTGSPQDITANNVMCPK
jgi:hypothetical protein